MSARRPRYIFAHLAGRRTRCPESCSNLILLLNGVQPTSFLHLLELLLSISNLASLPMLYSLVHGVLLTASVVWPRLPLLFQVQEWVLDKLDVHISFSPGGYSSVSIRLVTTAFREDGRISLACRMSPLIHHSINSPGDIFQWAFRDIFSGSQQAYPKLLRPIILEGKYTVH